MNPALTRAAFNDIADYFGVFKSTIDPRYGEIPKNLIPVKKYRQIPVLGEIACGDPILAEENIEEYREEIDENLPTGEVFYLKIRGNSMVPTIPSDSYVLIRRQPVVEDGEIAPVIVNGDSEATLKRVKHVNDVVMLMPDNNDYHPYIIDENNPARILGKAVKVSFDL
ncbi:TPA: LexA family protein [Enterococcus faecium]